MNLTRKNRSISLMACITATVLGAAAIFVGPGEVAAQPKPGAAPPPKVTVAQPVKRTLSDYDEYVGRFAAVNSVEVRARVSGYLDGSTSRTGRR